MPRWEYDILDYNSSKCNKCNLPLLNFLNELGKEGWEAWHKDENASRIYVKREIPEPAIERSSIEKKFNAIVRLVGRGNITSSGDYAVVEAIRKIVDDKHGSTKRPFVEPTEIPDGEAD